MKMLAPIAKAVIGGIAAFIAALGTALTTGESLGQVDAKTWLAAALAGVLGLGLVYAVPNKTAPPAP